MDASSVSHGEGGLGGVSGGARGGIGGGEGGGVTRLAPSPTGALHLGNARTFVVNWILARRHGWKILLRIEDLDGPRVKAGADRGAIEDLAWLGLDWDEGPTYQSADWDVYAGEMERLARAGLVYPCALTRKEIEAAASAPQEGGGEVRFDPALRGEVCARGVDDRETNWRFVVDAGEVRFADAFCGGVVREPAESIGDFVVWTKRGTPSYQLAVVVDDARQGVDRIVRGDDLLDSAARQALLRGALGYGREIRQWHLPLVVGEDGRRLAKRHGDTRIAAYRERGVRAERVIGLLMHWCGVGGSGGGGVREMGLAEAGALLDLDRMSRERVVFDAECARWLG